MDAVGQAILDYHRGKEPLSLIVHSSISEEDEIPVNYLFRNWDEMPELEKKALNLCRGRVLDVGAAAGAHSIELKRKGFQVTSIDTSPGAVEVMRERELDDVQLQNYFEFSGETFDTLLFMMNGVGIAGTIENLPNFLKKAKELLNDGGQVLLDSSDISYMFENEDGSVWIDLNVAYHGEVEYQFEYGNIKSESFYWLFIDFPKLQSIAESLGWSVELIYEGDHFEYLTRLTLR